MRLIKKVLRSRSVLPAILLLFTIGFAAQPSFGQELTQSNQQNREQTEQTANSSTNNSATIEQQDGNASDEMTALADALFSKKKAIRLDAIETLSSSSNPNKYSWLQAILDGNLYQVKADNTLAIAVQDESKTSFKAVSDGHDLGAIKKRKLRRFPLDNATRSRIKLNLSTMRLQDPDTNTRLLAVNELLGTSETETVEHIRTLLNQEKDSKVHQAMETLIAIHDLNNGTDEQIQAALNMAQGNLNLDMINALRELESQTENPSIKEEAQTLVSAAEAKQRWYRHIETLFFGLSLGSVLVIAAIGLAITFGVMGVINMAHGELIMLGAYTTYFIQQLFPNSINTSLILAIPAAFLVSGITGVIIEKTVIRHLYGRPLETLLATFGISLILQQAVRTFVSSQNVAVITPAWMSGSWVINPALSLTLNRLVIIVFCLLVFSALMLLMTRTQFGLHMRAVVQNRPMARAMGIPSSNVDALTFGLGSGVAGIAGVALSQLGNVGPNLGQNYIIDSFMVVVFGGVGSLWGTLVAGLSMGIANKLLEPWAGAVLGKILLLVFIILFIQKRPKGLFPQRGRVEA